MKSQIKITIYNKEYTLKAEAQDEELLKEAAAVLTEKITAKKQRLGVSKLEDLLAIAAFDIVVEQLRSRETLDHATERIGKLNYLLDQVLEQDQPQVQKENE
ncbi:cell division protein ZapA [Algivirga pacifica]|uniref:Cell division protein ZapA n=1 Tax=Algivirga pacifica TaxID=1162670 RepID=A0ABP9DL26_9BACT